MTGGYMRYTDMFEQYKGYGNILKPELWRDGNFVVAG